MTNNEKIDELLLSGEISIDLSHIDEKYRKIYPLVVQTYAQMSYCMRKKVGAILVSQDYSNQLSYGFNGTLPGFPNDCECADGSTNEQIVLHAETNCITKASKNGINTKNTSLWCSFSPCSNCAKLIIQSGIKEVYFLYTYKDVEPIKILNKAGVKCYLLIS